MNRARRNTLLLFYFLFAACLPAYANEPPAPDGMLSLMMIIPVAILGLRLAGAKLPPRGKAERILTGLALGFSILFCAAGAGGAIFALAGWVFLLGYGIWRGAQALKHGMGWRRFAAGFAVILFTPLAFADYFASLNWYYYTTRHLEVRAVTRLYTIRNAQQQFQISAGKFGTLDGLIKAGFLEGPRTVANLARGYQIVEVRSDDPVRAGKEYFVYASPENYGSSGPPVLPGSSLWEALRPPKPRSVRTFTLDESGVIRAADLGRARAVTRQEAQKWKEFNWED